MNSIYDDEIGSGEIQPVLLLGAPRSGTQMFRDMICSHDDICTWPYNEMTYMWRYNNRTSTTEELDPALADDKAIRYIRNQFIKLSKKTGSRIVLDKTCHNCLRIPFVQKVFPEAKFIYLIRNGMDVVPSMHKRWVEPPPKGEYSRIFSIPRKDFLYYTLKVGWNHLGLFQPGVKQVRVWGPNYDGLQDLVGTMSLYEVCAHQWLKYTDECEKHIYNADFSASLVTLKYDEITKDSTTSLETVFDYLSVGNYNTIAAEWKPKMKHHRPGEKGKTLGDHEQKVMDILHNKLIDHGYGSSIDLNIDRAKTA